MNTRALESKDVLRASVTQAEMLEVTTTSLLLKMIAVVAVKKELSSADLEVQNGSPLSMVGDVVEGRVRIDVLADTVLRVRYAEGMCVPENVTPMVIGTPPAPSHCAIDISSDCIDIFTAKLHVIITLAPYQLTVYDLGGQKICSAGGPEKDYFANWDSYNMGICRTRPEGAPVAVESFDLRHDECIYGLGEKFIKLNKVGQTIDLNMIDALGVTTPRSYKNIPFFVSNRGYGIFFNHSSLMSYWVGSMSAVDVQVAAEDDFLDYYLMTGSIKEVLASYTNVTGKGVLPPKWSFGYWQSKISYSSAQEVIEIAHQLRAHDIPCDVIHLDTDWYKADWYCDLQFDEKDFPDLPAFTAEMERLGFKISLWQLPYIPEGSQLFNDLKAVDGFVKDIHGDIYSSGICFTPDFNGVVGVVDYTNPEAIRVQQQAFRKLFRLGAVKVIKTDFGEAAPLDGIYHDGTPGSHMHNLYPLLYNKAIFEVTKEETGDGVVWARSAWAGNQRYPLHWGGDNSPNYFNMAPQIEGGLSFGLSGFQFWSQDIGGFYGAINERLLIRWMQVGMFVSHSRIHGFGDRELYKFAPEVVRICRNYLHLRYQLMPYIFGSARQCVEQSLPMARALVVEYQHDPSTWNIGDEHLFGDSLLVAPIYSEEDHRRVYLPEGVWTDWWTQARLTGNRWIEVETDLETLPLYIREGGIIPIGPAMKYVDEFPLEKLTLLVSLFTNDGQTDFTVPVNGAWVPVSYVARDGKHTITIGATDVEFMVETIGCGDVYVVRG